MSGMSLYLRLWAHARVAISFRATLVAFMSLNRHMGDIIWECVGRDWWHIILRGCNTLMTNTLNSSAKFIHFYIFVPFWTSFGLDISKKTIIGAFEASYHHLTWIMKHYQCVPCLWVIQNAPCHIISSPLLGAFLTQPPKINSQHYYPIGWPYYDVNFDRSVRGLGCMYTLVNCRIIKHVLLACLVISIISYGALLLAIQ